MVLGDGREVTPEALIVGTRRHEGTRRHDEIVTGRHDDVVHAGRGHDEVDSGPGHDVLHGEAGHDELEAGAGDDRLFGGDGRDALDGGFGFDVLDGGAGRDELDGGCQSDLLDGGSGGDELEGGHGADIVIGGAGRDEIELDQGADVAAFNRGDGIDTVESHDDLQRYTLSLGGGAALDDLTLERRGDDLILGVDGGVAGKGRGRHGAHQGQSGRDALVLEDWYEDDGASAPAVTLQMVVEASEGYDPDASDPLLRRRVQRFDFTRIVEAFDEAHAAGGGEDPWAAMDAALDAHLAGSDAEALGGDIAYRYGLSGSVAGIDRQTMLATLRDSRLGTDPQPFHPGG